MINITLTLATFDLNFCVNTCLNLLHNIGNQAIKSSSKIVFILDCKNLCAKIGFSNTILLFNILVISRNSFFLPTFFKVFCLFLSFKISWFTLRCTNSRFIISELLSTLLMLYFTSLINVSAYKPVLPTMATMFFFFSFGVKI